ncbi:anti-sigma factor [Angustibacter sp. McL0619]|uniref:anti-sigma factor n=1 Tax=Angustibacter sp. McL0619 TaxID=3415676 RepID=UPI003CED11C7
MSPDLHTLTGAYAVDALDDLERRQFEEHLRECDACTDEVRGLRAVGATLGLAELTAVPASLHDAVMARVRTTRQLPPLADPAQDPSRVQSMLRRARVTSRALVAVAAALLVIAGGLGAIAVHEHQQAEQSQQLATQMSQVIAAPDAKQVDAGDSAKVIVSPSKGEAVFVGQNLPAVDADHVLQLWVLQDGARSVGLIDGSQPLLATGLGPDAQLGVTVEPSGGSEQPTTTPVLTVPLA